MVSYTDNTMYTSDLKVGGYVVTIHGGPEAVPPSLPDSFVHQISGDTGPNPPLRGTFKGLFTIESCGTVTRGAEIVARRTLFAKVLVSRGELLNQDYQGYGRIFYLYEKNR